MKIVYLALALLLASCAPDVAVEPEPESIVFSYGYGTRGVATMPFGDDGPVVIECQESYSSI